MIRRLYSDGQVMRITLSIMALAAAAGLAGCASTPSVRRHAIPPGWATDGAPATESPVPSKESGLVSISLDAKASPFGAYDLEVVNAVYRQCRQIMDEGTFEALVGSVAIKCLQFSDGQVVDTAIGEGDAGGDLAQACRRAILQSSPWAPWPADMRRTSIKDFRVLTFTFTFYPGLPPLQKP